MVKYKQPNLDHVFGALADPTRRAIVAQLATQSQSVSELARPFSISLPAIMKHLDVLSDAGLVTRTKTGRTVTCALSAGPMEQAMDWLNRYQRFWSASLDRLATYLEEEQTCPPKPPSPTRGPSPASPRSPASPSSAGSRRRRRKSTPPGPSRRR